MESSGEVWKHYIPLSGFGTREFDLSLSQQTFTERTVFLELADPRAARYINGQMDLQAITYYAFYVGVGTGSPGSGTIYLDSVELR